MGKLKDPSKLVMVSHRKATPLPELSEAEKIVADALMNYAFIGGVARTVAIETVEKLKAVGLE
jgi:hypothetical protein